MSNLLDILDKYRYAIIATFVAYIALFMYLQLESYTQYFPIQPYNDGAFVVVPKEEIELKQENIEIPKDFVSQDIKSFAKDINDSRKLSENDFYKNKSASEIEQSVKDYEKKLFEESGGEAKRKKIQQEMEERNRKKKETATQNKEEKIQTGGETGFKGSTMVSWDLSNRNPHQNNEYWVRNPGYTCGPGMNGRVVILIKANSNGDIIGAEYDPTQSSGAVGCMVEQALKYAKMSRFNFSSSAPKIQSGKIIYTFVSQ